MKVASSNTKAILSGFDGEVPHDIIQYWFKVHNTKMLWKLGGLKIRWIMRRPACPSLYLMQSSSGFFLWSHLQRQKPEIQ